MSEFELRCCVSGSYRKYKPEIDQTISEFESFGVKVLQPGKGWIMIPGNGAIFRHLPNEVNKTPEDIEDQFLADVDRSNFLYVDNHGGYFGDMAALEIGFALGRGKPVFIREIASSLLDFNPEFAEQLVVATPYEVFTLLKPREKGSA